ncbi:SBBP repeat-containing protein, partial [Steroidobacter sp.]|uniref:SBBP repeat-containing protein n=1 Tax=Steroidobacter sp. TaxID=1978227 RepID=UPI001A4CB962
MTLLRFGVGLLLGSVAACAVVPHTSPTLVYSTYLGGPMTDDCDGIAVDAVGAMYLACHIYSAEYPDQSFVVIKLAPDGQAIEYNTRVGEGNASFIAVDKDGSAYVGGWTTAPDFPVTQGAFQPSFAGGERDLVVAKLAPNGDVVWSTFLGGAGDDVPAEVALDTAGSVYVVGTTDSANFPVTADAFQTRYQGNRDVFVTKLTASGSAVYSTYLGGSGSEERLAGIALADDGGAFVVGTTRSTDFPLVSPLQATRRGESDAFVAALDPAGKALRFSTYLGGSASEVTRHAAVDGQGSLYVAGRTMSADFPTTPGTLQPTHSGASAVFFVTKLDPSHRTLIYSTFVTDTSQTAKPTDWRAEWGL